jgi:hypothetical protein
MVRFLLYLHDLAFPPFLDVFLYFCCRDRIKSQLIETGCVVARLALNTAFNV